MFHGNENAFMIKLSILTVNLNNISGLQKTIESVIPQTFTDYEFIIIDGGSTDGSMDVIKKYQDNITSWVSEPDKGIYNAMNKGIKMAKGEYCLFLNSGDCLVDGYSLEQFMNESAKEDFIYGNLDTARGPRKYSNKLSFMTFFSGTITHQAVFIKTGLFQKYGLYDESLTIVADWQFFLKTIIVGNCTYKHIDKSLCNYDVTGVSTNPKYQSQVASQREKVLREMFPMMYDDYLAMNSKNKDLDFYLNSRLAQLVKKLHQSNLFKKIRGTK